MKRILIIAGAIFGILLIAVIALPFLIPTSVYKAQIESAATKAMGREVVLIGNPKLSIFPSISARIDGAEVANPPEFKAPLMVKAGELKATVKLWPLFSQRVEIDQISLSDATVNLERLEDGRANWEFPAGEPTQETGTEETESSGFETGIAKAGLRNTAVYFNDRQNKQAFALTDFNMTARLTALDAPFSSNGDGRLNGQAFDYDVKLGTIQSMLDAAPSELDIKLNTDLGDVSYDGTLTLNEATELAGAFTFDTSALGFIMNAAGVDTNAFNIDAFEFVSAAGEINGPIATAAVTLAKGRVKATGVDLNYAGRVTLGDTPVLDGKITLNAEDAQRLFKADQAVVAPLSVLGKVDFDAKISGPVTALSLSEIVFKQRGDDLITNYTGSASLGGAQTLSGALDITSDRPRALLQALDIALPEGETFQNFAVKGDVSGSVMSPKLAGATLTLDQTVATGSVGADLKGRTPRIEANLKMGTLDLTPFLGRDEAPAQSEPDLASDWDATPLALDGLKAVNATVTIAADNVLIDQITLSDAVLKTQLDSGRLSAIFRQDEKKPGFKAFDGEWSGDLVLDASRTTPTLRINALADGIAAQKMLTDLTGFSRLSGLGDVSLDLTSEGNSLKALVSGLDGSVKSSLADGALKGLNLAKLMRSADNLGETLRAGNLSLASFKDVVSPDAETDFTSFIGNMSLNNGVATLSQVQLNNPVIGATASGSIDLGARTIDLRFTPRLDRKAQGGGSTIGLADIPVPIRISGAWTNPSYGFDTDAVRAELTARARGTVADTIKDRIGGDAGNIIGGIIGGQTTQPQSPDTPAEGTEATETPKSLEDELKDRAVEGALGAIFGNPRKKETKEPEKEEAPN